MSTIVIGAGPAGLEAARTLQSRGEEVVVLEAKDHVGGRTRSDRVTLHSGEPADLGGSFIDLGQDKILDVCAELGVPLTPRFAMFHPTETGRFDGSSPLRHAPVLDGILMSDSQREVVASEVSQALTASPPDTTELVMSWAARSGLSAPARSLLAAVAGTNPVSHPALIPIGEFHPLTIGKVCWMFAEGADSLSLAMARDIDVRLEQPVRRVGHERGGFAVETDTDTFVARDVIVATPIPPLLRIGFDPVLPEWKVNAMLAAQMSQGGKVIGEYSRGSEIAAKLTHTAMSNGPIAAIWCRPVGPDDTVVVLGLIPDRGDGVLRNEQQALTALDNMVHAATGIEARRTSGIVKDWTQDEYASGVVTLVLGDVDRLVSQFAQSVGSLHFAGEHTAHMWANSMDGALRSGRRAAGEVLRRRSRHRG